MRCCILCGTQVSGGLLGANRPSASFHRAFGNSGPRMIILA